MRACLRGLCLLAFSFVVIAAAPAQKRTPAVGHSRHVFVSVTDPGVGIPVSQLDAVFGLFYQAEDPVSRRTGGMGLGLYISKEIITRHGGRIWAESAPPAGSTFSFALPRQRVATRATRPDGRSAKRARRARRS